MIDMITTELNPNKEGTHLTGKFIINGEKVYIYELLKVMTDEEIRLLIKRLQYNLRHRKGD